MSAVEGYPSVKGRNSLSQHSSRHCRNDTSRLTGGTPSEWHFRTSSCRLGSMKTSNTAKTLMKACKCCWQICTKSANRSGAQYETGPYKGEAVAQRKYKWKLKRTSHGCIAQEMRFRIVKTRMLRVGRSNALLVNLGTQKRERGKGECIWTRSPWRTNNRRDSLPWDGLSWDHLQSCHSKPISTFECELLSSRKSTNGSEILFHYDGRNALYLETKSARFDRFN